MKYSKNFINSIYIISFICFIISCNDTQQENSLEIQHGIVFSEIGKYGGWPANNGIWSWDNEILVGFVQADYKEVSGSMHTYDRSTTKNMYARSKDGGLTWSIEDAYKDQATESQILQQSMPDFTNPDFAMVFQRSENDNKVTNFYYSNNRGADWNGPYLFPDLNTGGVESRTDYIIDGQQEMNVFITVAKSNKEEGRVALARTIDGGVNWEIVSWVGPEPEGFDIMPSSLRLSPTELITTVRSRTADGQDLITAYASNDNGVTWEKLKNPVADTGKGGSPSALLKLQNGRLVLGYTYRSNYGSRVNIRFSSDNGRTWSDEIMLRGGDGANRDCGYPRMVQRPDGKVVMIYYWNNVNQEGTAPYRYIASTIFDPDQWK
jgi:hypothetical protein